jgi:GNAT superfamily N-acetyltransferase
VSALELRREAADGPAARSLWSEYMALVEERLGGPVTDAVHVFATPEAFAGGAWLVLYEDGTAVGCGGLRRLDGTTGEIKRMFVTARARGRGHGRRLLAALEELARGSGITRVRLLTTEVLAEARALYAAAGYVVVDAPLAGARQDFWMEKALL